MTQTISNLGDYINGKFVSSTGSTDGEWENTSPSDLKDVVFCASHSFAHIDKACEAASKAYSGWAHLSLDKRKEYMMRLKEIFLAHQEEIATTIARETGKPLWEATTEAKALAGKIDITLNHSLSLVEEKKIENALPGVDGFIRYKPRGVMAVVGPFNFPAHLPNGHIVPALVTGNTVVFKPSDKTPATGQLLAKMFDEAELPPGVFNMIQGQGETGKRLVASHKVDGVLFTGSYGVGLKIKQDTLTHYRKILALEMGGKNTSVVWEDADLEKAVYENIIGGYLSAGQRCSCTSKIIIHPKVKDKFIENFYETAKKLTIGHWSENPFMGPLISADSVEKYLRFQEIAKREGAECIMRGKALDVGYEGNYVTPSIYQAKGFDPESVYQQSEIFGPNICMIETSDFDEALKITNSTGYGLVMSLFSKNRELYERALIDARVGLLNWNRTTNGASSRLPFGGMGKSGNDRPSGQFAVNYTTVPVATLEDSTPFDPKAVMTGIDYKFKG